MAGLGSRAARFRGPVEVAAGHGLLALIICTSLFALADRLRHTSIVDGPRTVRVGRARSLVIQLSAGSLACGRNGIPLASTRALLASSLITSTTTLRTIDTVGV